MSAFCRTSPTRSSPSMPWSDRWNGPLACYLPRHTSQSVLAHPTAERPAVLSRTHGSSRDVGDTSCETLVVSPHCLCCCQAHIVTQTHMKGVLQVGTSMSERASMNMSAHNIAPKRATPEVSSLLMKAVRRRAGVRRNSLASGGAPSSRAAVCDSEWCVIVQASNGTQEELSIVKGHCSGRGRSICLAPLEATNAGG